MSKNVTISKEHLVSQVEGNIVSDMDGEKVMLSIQNSKYYNLGEMGGEIWELIKDPIIVQDLITKLLNQFDVDVKKCEKHVLSFLKQLSDDGLIQAEIRRD